MNECDSCFKKGVAVYPQTNFGVKRNMCKVCCEAANEVETMLSKPRAEKARDRYFFRSIDNKVFSEAS
jgi:hypothetical protein